jgi:hypothetical protein
MKPVLLLSILNCCVTPLVRANSQEVEIRRLLAERIGHLYSVGQALEGVWERAGQGGYILRAQVDLTGDAKPELLLSTTMQAWRHSTIWEVYSQNADGALQRFAQPLTLAIGSYQPARDPDGEFVLLNYDRHDRQLLVEKVRAEGVETVAVSNSNNELDTTDLDVDETKANYYDNYAEKWPGQEFVVEALKVYDFIAGRTAWRTIDQRLVVMPDDGYFLSSTDAEEMKANKDFTPQMALEMLRKLPPIAAGPPAGRDAPSSEPPGIAPTAGKRSREERVSVFSSAYAGLWAGVCLLAAAALLLVRQCRAGMRRH